MRQCRSFRLDILILSLLLFSFFHKADIFAQTAPLWGGMQQGPHGIGFQTIEKYDYSRTFRAKYDYFGMPLSGERARPIQICIWYPCEKTIDASEMVYGEYLFPEPENSRFYDFLARVQGREIRNMHYLFSNDRGLVLDAMNIKMAAVRNARPIEGTFPLIIYSPDMQNGFSDNLVMCEFLASHGFVVVTTHSVGITALNPEADHASLEALVRDKEFALAHMRDIEYVDKDKLGAFGLGFGGLASLILQMRNSDVEVVAGLEAWNTLSDRIEFVSQSPYYNAKKMNVPFLQMYREDEQLHDLTLVDSCKYSDRYLLEFQEMPDRGLSSYGAIRSIMSDSADTMPGISRPNYEIACRYVLNFFNAHLKKDEAGLGFINNSPTDNGIDPNLLSFRLLPGQDLPPTGDQFIGIIRYKGAHKAVEIYEKFKQSDPGSITFREETFNALGYEFLQTNRVEEAVEVFRMNAEAYPQSANCWDSFADGCIAAGDHDRAIQCYEKVLEILPNDSLINEQLRETLRDNAVEGIKRLRNE